MCDKSNYALVALHAKIQTAAAYEMLGMRATALPMLSEALTEAEADMCIIPAAENYRYLKQLIREFKPSDFIDQICAAGEIFEANCSSIRSSNSMSNTLKELTGREIEIAVRAAGNMSNREIAAEMFLSEGTIKQYINRIYSKMGIEGDYRSKRKRLAQIVNQKSEDSGRTKQ